MDEFCVFPVPTWSLPRRLPSPPTATEHECVDFPPSPGVTVSHVFGDCAIQHVNEDREGYESLEALGREDESPLGNVTFESFVSTLPLGVPEPTLCDSSPDSGEEDEVNKEERTSDDEYFKQTIIEMGKKGNKTIKMKLSAVKLTDSEVAQVGRKPTRRAL